MDSLELLSDLRTVLVCARNSQSLQEPSLTTHVAQATGWLQMEPKATGSSEGSEHASDIFGSNLPGELIKRSIVVWNCKLSTMPLSMVFNLVILTRW